MAIENTYLGKGTQLSAGFDLQTKTPLDSRTTVKTYAGLIALVNGNAAYEGMQVFVETGAEKGNYQYLNGEWINKTAELEAELATKLKTDKWDNINGVLTSQGTADKSGKVINLDFEQLTIRDDENHTFTAVDAQGINIFKNNGDSQTLYEQGCIKNILDTPDDLVYSATLILPTNSGTLALQNDVDIVKANTEKKLDANGWTTDESSKLSLEKEGESTPEYSDSHTIEISETGITIDHEVLINDFNNGTTTEIGTDSISIQHHDSFASIALGGDRNNKMLEIHHSDGTDTKYHSKGINYAEKELTFPDKAGTIALASDVSSLATGQVQTNTRNISAINHETTGILAKAKTYSDEQDVFHTDILTVNALGGVAAGADLDGLTVREVLNTLLYPYVAFVINSSSRTAATATLENGATQTLSSCSISVTKKSKPITSIKLFNGSTLLQEKTGTEVTNGGTITFNGFDAITISKSNNPNLKFTVTDGQTSTDRNVGASTFVYPYYWGECAADATINETLIEGLTKRVESKGNKTVTHTMNNGCMVIAYPKAHGVLKSILDPNNFETIGDYTRSEVSITGLDGTAQTYYVYASGAATVSSFKVQYKY